MNFGGGPSAIAFLKMASQIWLLDMIGKDDILSVNVFEPVEKIINNDEKHDCKRFLCAIGCRATTYQQHKVGY